MELPPLNSHLIKRAMEIFGKVLYIYIYIYIYIYFKTPLSRNCAVHEALFLCFLFWFGQAAVSRNFQASSVPVITIIRDWLAIIQELFGTIIYNTRIFTRFFIHTYFYKVITLLNFFFTKLTLNNYDTGLQVLAAKKCVLV